MQLLTNSLNRQHVQIHGYSYFYLRLDIRMNVILVAQRKHFSIAPLDIYKLVTAIKKIPES